MSHDDPIPALKRQLGVHLARLVGEWNNDDVAAIVGTDRARISELRRQKLDRFSLERLIRFLARLDHQVEMTVGRERFVRRAAAPTKE